MFFAIPYYELNAIVPCDVCGTLWGREPGIVLQWCAAFVVCPHHMLSNHVPFVCVLLISSKGGGQGYGTVRVGGAISPHPQTHRKKTNEHIKYVDKKWRDNSS